MSLHRPSHPHLHLEPLEDRFLLSPAALTAPVADRPPTVPGQYAVLLANPAITDTARPAFNQPLPLDRPAASTPSRAGRDGDDYLPQREEGVAADSSDSHHAEALALVRTLTARSEQTGEPIRPAPLGPGTPPAPAVAIRTLAPADDSSAPHALAVLPVGTLDSPFALAAEESVTMPPVPVVIASAGTEPKQGVEVAAPAAESALPVSGLAPEPGDPLAGLYPLDVQALRRNADASFARLADLVRGPGEGLSVRALAPWLLLGWAAAWEAVLLSRALRGSGSTADPLLLGTEDEA